MQIIRITEFNRVPALYTSVLELQESLFAQRKANLIDDTLLVLQVQVHDTSLLRFIDNMRVTID
jgi:rRNA pseudouridine-1189 N-methylase Emg1 (Nep1/Mra1 family)